MCCSSGLLLFRVIRGGGGGGGTRKATFLPMSFLGVIFTSLGHSGSLANENSRKVVKLILHHFSHHAEHQLSAG